MLYGKNRTKPINHKKNIDPNLACPKCEASYQFLYLFGHDGNFQKFRCALCQRQFAPDKPLKPKKEPIPKVNPLSSSCIHDAKS
jgi:transposase-like protein